MKTNTFKRKSNERAQGMVEFALVLPILLLLVFGVIEFGRLLFIYSAVTTASREAVRYGSAVDDTSGTYQFADCAGIEAAARRIGSLVGLDTVTITYDNLASDPDGTVCSGSFDPDQVVGGDSRILVEVSASYQPLVPLVNIPPFPITSDSVRTIVKDIELGEAGPPGGGGGGGGGGGTDSDSDGVDDSIDNCPSTANADQANADGDDYGDVCDNCPSTSNNSQTNSDGDTLGDACDNCPSTDNEGQTNSDGDSWGDACDNCPSTDNEDQADSDTDGIGDACEAAPPSDPDVSITSGNSPIDENGGVSTITVTLSEAHTSQDVIVNFGAGGTAQSEDYSLSATQVTIPQGTLEGSITITGVDDSDDDDGEVVIVSITSADNANVVSPSTYSIEITDDDVPASNPLIYLSMVDSSGKQNKNFWHPAATITVMDDSSNVLSGALVTGNWDNGLGSSSCTTTVSGVCEVQRTMVSTSTAPVNFTVTSVIVAGYDYTGTDTIELNVP